MSDEDQPGGASGTDMIYLPWTRSRVPRHLHTLVMMQLENLEDRHPDLLPEFLRLAREPRYEPPAAARGAMARLAFRIDHQQVRDIILESEYARGVKAPRAAEIMTGRLGVEVTADGVAELWRRGVIPVTGEFGDEPLFDRVAAGRLDDAALAAEATRAGRLLGPDEAAERLQISRKAFDWLVTCGYIRSCERMWDARIVPGLDGFVYIAQDLDRLVGDPRVDWQALRAAPEGPYRDVRVPEPDVPPPGSPWFRTPCSPHCRCRLVHGRQPP